MLLPLSPGNLVVTFRGLDTPHTMKVFLEATYMTQTITLQDLAELEDVPARLSHS